MSLGLKGDVVIKAGRGGAGRGGAWGGDMLPRDVMVNQTCTYRADSGAAELSVETLTRGGRQTTANDTEGEETPTLDVIITSVDYTDYKHLLPCDVIITSVDYTDYIVLRRRYNCWCN